MSQHPKFHYVYILQSQTDPSKHYTGLTTNLNQRLTAHNEGLSTHTEKHKPWTVLTAIALNSEEKALNFEKYLKSHSGRTFAAKRL